MAGSIPSASAACFILMTPDLMASRILEVEGSVLEKVIRRLEWVNECKTGFMTGCMTGWMTKCMTVFMTRGMYR